MQTAQISLSSLAAFLVLLGCAPLSAPPTPTPSMAASSDRLGVAFLDVGQGDAIALVTPEDKVVVIDGGGRRSGVADYLAALGVSEVEVMVATNPDADHIGGLIEVLRRFPVRHVWLSGQEHTTITFEEFVDLLLASNADVRAVRRGDQFSIGSVRFDVLHPREPFFSGRNNNSVVVKATYGSVTFLFAGDAEAEAEEDMLRSGLDLRATVLKIAHHGSSSSTTPAFAAAVQPQLAVYQAGVNNQFGHPHRETLQTLRSFGDLRIMGTDRNGTIVVTTDGKEFKVESQR